MASHSGVYRHVRDENLREFVETRAANFMGAKMMCKVRPTVTINVDDDGESYTMKSEYPNKNFEWEFKIGDEATLPTPEGMQTFVFTLDDGKLIQKPVGDLADCGVHVEREFTDEGMTMSLIHEESGDTGKRIFRRQ